MYYGLDAVSLGVMVALRSVLEYSFLMNHFYHGVSMSGFLRDGDRLSVEPVSFEQVRCGDVIVFGEEGACGWEVVHRVQELTPQGLVTRGDRSKMQDSGFVTADRLVGRLAEYERGGRSCKVSGGVLGQVYARTWRFAWWIRRNLSPYLRPLYRVVGRGMVRMIDWKPDVLRLRLEIAEGPLVKYVHGMRTVARWNGYTGCWRCCKPYDLILSRPSSDKAM